ncbi:cytochrome c maturation protein CcmE domain-containing protein [Sediminitomix flava]|uniref:Cytochrome c-type biogenesis protein CcmE n=1 Tax=Sediminitomix flava TaxID=379075 RepID=A0A315ZZ19_SEDFL|nr:cytochrome c maturation protein CcmE [Sediminitomix flava]PWJ42617.1 cytochrome c-type biogenesis protein CcmE [Sediminitomix flava]
MKKLHIFFLAIIAIGIGLIVSTAGNASQYVTFSKAEALAADGDNAKIHVIGELTKEGGVVTGIEYNPAKDPNFLAFMLEDEDKIVRRVVCYNPPPSMRDFEKSEKVVVIGRAGDKGDFVASEILMKCPSKYEEKQL